VTAANASSAAGSGAAGTPTLLLDFSLVAPGGSQTHAIGFLRALAERDDLDRIVVVAPADGPAELEQPLQRLAAGRARVVRTTMRSGLRSAIARQLTIPYFTARFRADAVFCPRETAPVLTPARLVVLAGNVAVWSTHSNEPRRVQAVRLVRRPLAHLSVRRSTAIAAVSRVMAAALPARAARRAVVIHHGCDLDPVATSRLETDSAGPLRILALGTVTHHKRYDRLIDHVAAVHALGLDAKLNIWGPLPDAQHAAELRERGIARLGYDPLMGPAAPAERQAILARADVVAVSSSFESFAMPLVEAMTTRCLVWTPGSALVDELCGEVAVTYHEDADPSLAAGALIDALPAVRDRLAAGQQRGAAFTWTQTVEQTLTLMRSAARDHRGQRRATM
jgi:glycosyltransferase involved in cell wall biosynthesis